MGFGGKFGVQEDRQDKSAVGWEERDKLQQHESQIGNYIAILQPYNQCYYLYLYSLILSFYNYFNFFRFFHFIPFFL